MNRSTIVVTSCTIFGQTIDECARIGGRPKTGSKTDDTDPRSLPRPHTDPARERSVGTAL